MRAGFVSIINHLWQSTFVFVLALLLTWVLRRNQARTRYWVWMVASAKFLVPFSLFVAIGEWLRPTAEPLTESRRFASAIVNIAQPFSANSQNIEPLTARLPEPAIAVFSPHHVHLLPALLLTVWLFGFLFLLVRWARSWRTIRATVRSASPMPLSTDVPVLT
jgi:beta-lactamase regulating signal transducer with metallopeptidase domain